MLYTFNMATKHEVYERLVKAMNGRPTKKLDRNTYARQDGPNRIIVSLHGNDIITATPNIVTYRDCGWKTVTTKDRLNQWMPAGCYVHQEDFCWFFSTPTGNIVWINGVTHNKKGKVTKVA